MTLKIGDRVRIKPGTRFRFQAPDCAGTVLWPSDPWVRVKFDNSHENSYPPDDLFLDEAVSTDGPPPKWKVVELDRLGCKDTPKEQPTLDVRDAKTVHVLLPASFLAGFTSECKLMVGDAGKLAAGAASLNPANHYGYDNLHNWRGWACSNGLPALRKQLQDAIDW